MTKTIYTDHKDFISNKYSNWYYSIISKAKSQDRRKGIDIYYENHHILPKSIFPEFTREKWNQVLLTAKEHFICHHLLTKFIINKPKYSMYHAFIALCFLENNNQTRYKITPLIYEKAKKLNSIAISNIHKGRIFNESYKQKIREGLSIGTFVTPWGSFVSATQAGKECPTGKLSPHTMLNYCKNNNKILNYKTTVQSRYFSTEDEGKTFCNLGFSFISRLLV